MSVGARSGWRLVLFGAPYLEGPEGSIRPLPRQQSVLLLAYLASPPGKPRSRDELAALLWPQEEPALARASLRTPLRRLRRLLEVTGQDVDEILLASRPALCLVPGAFRVDTAEFEAAAARARAARETLEHRELLEATLALYSGEFLAGFDSDWVLKERGRLAGAYARVARSLSTVRARTGDREGAFAAARLALEAAPEDERFHRHLMRLHTCVGNLPAARAHYDALARRLQAEHERLPEPETQALAQELREKGGAGPATGEAARPILPPALDAATLRLMLERSDVVSRAQLAVMFAEFWEMDGHLDEGRSQLKRLVEEVAGADPATRAAVLSARARFPAPAPMAGDVPCAPGSGHWEAAVPLEEESLAIRRSLGDERAVADSLLALSQLRHAAGETVAARELASESLAISRRLGDRRGTAAALYRIGMLLRSEGRLAEAGPPLEKSLALHRELEDSRGILHCLDQPAGLYGARGPVSARRTAIEERLQLCRTLGYRRETGYALLQAAHMALQDGDAIQCRARYEESLAIFQEIGDPLGTSEASDGLAGLAFQAGDLDGAEARWRECLRLREDAGLLDGVAWTFNSFGNVALRRGDLPAARSFYRRGMAIHGRVNNRAAVTLAMRQRAEVIRRLGHSARAEKVLAECLRRAEADENRHLMTVVLTGLAQLAHERGDLERASQLEAERQQVQAIRSAA